MLYTEERSYVVEGQLLVHNRICRPISKSLVECQL
jgi:hypothetical protein